MIALCSQAKGGVFLAPCDLWRIYLLGLENDDYREHLNDLLEEGIPRYVFFLDAFPVNESGKILKRDLRPVNFER